MYRPFRIALIGAGNRAMIYAGADHRIVADFLRGLCEPDYTPLYIGGSMESYRIVYAAGGERTD